MTDTQRFQKIMHEAHDAGLEAVQKLQVDPMIVTNGARNYFVEDGVCGFAWVTFKPGNSKLANWLKKQGIARKAYGGGVSMWISEFNQSYQKKMAYAQAFAEVFRQHGFDSVWADGRLD